MIQLRLTQHICCGLTPLPFGTLLPSDRNVVYGGNVMLTFKKPYFSPFSSPPEQFPHRHPSHYLPSFIRLSLKDKTHPASAYDAAPPAPYQARSSDRITGWRGYTHLVNPVNPVWKIRFELLIPSFRPLRPLRWAWTSNRKRLWMKFIDNNGKAYTTRTAGVEHGLHG